MKPLDFIEVNVKAELKKEGYSDYVAANCSREAVKLYARKSHFQKGKVFDECLKLGRKQAKLMDKAGI